jgi:hypothetical protein
MTLAELQTAYRDYLMNGDSGKLGPEIVANAFDAAERLSIYRNNFLTSLVEALKSNFPVTLQLLGGEFFEQAARRYVPAHPPRRPCLFEYGAEFPGYLGALPELAALPYVAEVAWFEFARVAAYNAAVERYVSADTLATLSPDQLDGLPVRQALHVQALFVKAPVVPLWTAHQVSDADLSGIDLAERSHALLVCRPDRTLVVRELDVPAARFLSAAQRGTSLGRAAAESGTEDDATLSRIIATALQLRLLAMVED